MGCAKEGEPEEAGVSIALLPIQLWPSDCVLAASQLEASGVKFDLLNASNVVDYLGLLPCSGAFAPLLRDDHSCLELEVMMGMPRDYAEMLNRS